MSTVAVCPCDGAAAAPLTNLPGLAQIGFRAGDFNDFRRALLTPLLAPSGQAPLEQSLVAWRSGAGSDPSAVDLAVMMMEWWAYLADILTFYNERIANEDYLRTALLPETPAELIRLLGYRPRPAIGATGTLAALVSPSLLTGKTVTLPAGLQFQSKPGPGAAPQTFELTAATPIGTPDRVIALPPQNLVAQSAANVYSVLLQGTVKSLSQGAILLLGTRDDTTAAAPITLNAAPSFLTVAGGLKQTQLSFTGTPPQGLSAANARLLQANQRAALWTVNSGTLSGQGNTVIQLATLVRQIQAGDWVLLTAGQTVLQLAQVQQVSDVLGDAQTGGSALGLGSEASPIPILHTQLTLDPGLSNVPSSLASVSVLFGWVEVGTLVDQPPAAWDGQGVLQAVQPMQFAPAASAPVLLQDVNGTGAAATVNQTGGTSLSVNWPTTTAVPLSPGLQPPIDVFYNLLAVTCGKTVVNEIVGSGKASMAGQSFTLAKSPVTYLMSGSTYASTISLTVDGQPWTEVESFYGQPVDAQVFVTREDAQQITHIDFGDGVNNGARLPTGTNNVVATYRVGAGAASPPAGKLTVIAQSCPGLQSVVNPVAVSGGSDPDPPSLLRTYAPRSVLTFGRAVSVLDYQALAAQAPGVSMATAVWSWDASNQRAGVVVYVAGATNVATSVQTVLVAAGDPNRPVFVREATAITVTLTLGLLVTAGMDSGAIESSVTTALCDPLTGLFSPPSLGIGQALFDSRIDAACLAVSGVVAIQSCSFVFNDQVDPGPQHLPGEGAFFSLASADLFLNTEAQS
ncbi:baseplate J/gp47 family protein [Paraburkholderia sp. MM5482-R1]|uniref:baseplate J/gp47 family protein n=1 Tax=unclassified Paraburkholderia TaxID=2615204 RepID=UPI003D1A5D9F